MTIPLTWGLVGLFTTSFLAATFLPFGSEPYVVYMIKKSGHSAALIVTVATVGNFLGSVLTYYMGRFLPLEKAQKYLKISDISVERAKKVSARFGPVAAFFVFLPFIGDALALVLGFFISIFLGKLVRYIAIAFLISYF